MSKETTSTGVSLSSLLGVAFIVLKLCHVINWSWWWVCSPFWIPVAFVLAIFLGGGIIVGLLCLLAAALNKVKG